MVDWFDPEEDPSIGLRESGKRIENLAGQLSDGNTINFRDSLVGLGFLLLGYCTGIGNKAYEPADIERIEDELFCIACISREYEAPASVVGLFYYAVTSNIPYGAGYFMASNFLRVARCYDDFKISNSRKPSLHELDDIIQSKGFDNLNELERQERFEHSLNGGERSVGQRDKYKRVLLEGFVES